MPLTHELRWERASQRVSHVGASEITQTNARRAYATSAWTLASTSEVHARARTPWHINVARTGGSVTSTAVAALAARCPQPRVPHGKGGAGVLDVTARAVVPAPQDSRRPPGGHRAGRRSMAAACN